MKFVKYTFAFIYFLILNFTIIFAQPKQEWLRRYNGSANSFDIVSNLQTDINGNVYVYGSENGIGSLYDFVIIKYSPSGIIKWIHLSEHSLQLLHLLFLPYQVQNSFFGFLY